MDKLTEPTDDQTTAEIMNMAASLQNTIAAFAKQAKRWNNGICPICKSSLDPTDASAAGHRSSFEIVHQMQSKLQQITGHCGECMLSPSEVGEEEITKWIWMRLPGSILVNGNPEFTLRAEGSTLTEAIDDIGRKYPDAKSDMLKTIGVVVPHPSFEVSINWVPVSSLDGLSTPVKGGDYVKFPSLEILSF